MNPTLPGQSPRQRAMRARRFLALLLIVPVVGIAVGCGGPTHTAGTRGVEAADLAVLSIPQLPAESPVQIDAVQFDGAGDPHAIGKGRDFYLLPGDHTATFSL